MKRDGTKHPIADNGAPIKDERGTIVGTVLVFRDITERVQAEAEQKATNRKYQSLIRALGDVVYEHLVPEGIIHWSEAFEQILGYTKPEIGDDDQSWLDRVHPDDLPAVESEFDLAFRENRVYDLEYRFRHKSGQYMWVHDRGVMQVGDNGELATVIGIMKDVTDRKQAEEALLEAQEKLVRQEKLAMLGQLAGGVGHELRNPLGAIKNAVYFLNMVFAEQELEPEVKETLEILAKEVGTSERIISSLLDFARPKPLVRRKIDVSELVQETLSHIALPENVDVTSQLVDGLPVILADPDQLAQVFGNIIRNGLQAMPQGGRLTVRTAEVSGWVVVSIADTGVGIPEEALSKIFEPLFTTKAKGIGLGLAVTKTLIEGHEGCIEVQSEEGKGSTFTVKLPTGGKEE
jgi:PAS domain S-box-containing protein